MIEYLLPSVARFSYSVYQMILSYCVIYASVSAVNLCELL